VSPEDVDDVSGQGRAASRTGVVQAEVDMVAVVFREGRTGRLSIASWPNVPLWIWIATAMERRVPFVHVRADTALALPDPPPWRCGGSAS
jgi:hypothetical protein